MRDFRNLKVWHKAHQVALDVYAATGTFPGSELYGLTSQLRRSAHSIPSNLADGCGRRSDREFGRAAHIAMGSACELEYLPLLARDLKLLSPGRYDALDSAVCEVRRMLAALIETVTGARGSREAESCCRPSGRPPSSLAES